jgi:hypothetical protein
MRHSRPDVGIFDVHEVRRGCFSWMPPGAGYDMNPNAAAWTRLLD